MKRTHSIRYKMLAALLVLSLCACKKGDDPEPSVAQSSEALTTAAQNESDATANTPKETQATPESGKSTEVTTEAPSETAQPAETETEKEDLRPAVVTSPEISVRSGFYEAGFEVSIEAVPGADIRYTTDGSEPSEKSKLYTEPITIAEADGDNPKASILRARAFGANGFASDISTEVYFVGKGLTTRFHDIVISIVGDPDGLTGTWNGIFSNKNYDNRGREWERAVSIKMWDTDGNLVLDQDGGVRVYGAYSRRYKIKSMKIFSRKSYDSEHPDFETDIFQTPKADGSGMMSVYDKLVIRNGGNDFQFGFMRDELNQLLLAEAGYPEYENVLPAICYLNGKYYGYFWLHESYCDDYFKEKYGKKEGGRGEFIVVEGSDQTKKEDDDDKDKNDAAAAYNEMYETYAHADLTDDTVYNKLRECIDVENYLDYFAANIIVSNKDWPDNNYKCFRYFASSGESYGEGVYDGRWRYLPHDMDYSYSIYGQKEVQPDYDMLKHLLATNDVRSAPLFASLMKREDCKTYFKDKVKSLLETAFSEDSINAMVNRIMEERAYEMDYYYIHLDTLKSRNPWEQDGIWCTPPVLVENANQIRDFARRRPEYLLEILEKRLP